MKNWKQVFGLGMVLPLCFSLLAGCGSDDPGKNSAGDGQGGTRTEGENPEGTQGTDERPTFTVATVRYNDLWSTDFFEEGIFRELEDRFQINIEWQIYTAADWAEKKAVMMSGGELPDAFFGSLGMAETDYLDNPSYYVDIAPYMDEYMPNFKRVIEEDPEMLYRVMEPDGKIYSLGKRLPLRPKAAFVPFINQVWLDNLELEMPETYEDLANVLKAFASEDANGNGDSTDEIPFSSIQNLSVDLNQFLQSFGTCSTRSGTYMALDGEGNLIFMPVQEKYKEAVKWAHELYEAGVFESEAFTQDAGMYYSKNQADGGCRVGMVFGWDINTEVGQYANEFVPLPAVTGPDGNKYIEYDPACLDVSNCEFLVTYKCQDPARLLQWADAFYEDEVTLRTYYGDMPDCITKNEDGSWLVLKDPDATFAWCHGPRDFGPKHLSDETAAMVSFEEGNSDGAKLAIDELYKDCARNVNCAAPMFKYTEEEYDVLQVVMSDILGYCGQQYAHWVQNGGIDEEWDAYIAKLESMGLKDYLKVMDSAYARYKEVIGE